MSSNKIVSNINETEFLNPILTEQNDKRTHFKKRNSQFIYKTVHNADIDEHLDNGWEIARKNRKTTRIKKTKTHDVLLEDQLWCLFYKLGYESINGEKFNISFTRSDGSTGRKQIDVYASDDETAVVIECKSRENRGRRNLQKDLHESILLQKFIRKSIYQNYKNKTLPKVIWIYATNNIIWSEPDVDRAKSGNIIILTENEVQYFQAFIKHLGPASKYQILSEFLKGQKIPGMPDVKIPAIKGKIGGETFFSFVTTPRDLLRISFINHQAFNHPDGRPAYQRMISSNRIKNIGKFIIGGGYFPTNILINFIDKPTFKPLSNKENTDPNIKFGWLELPKKYRSAWVIDGQHRLYGYSKLDDKYLDQSLFVLAFEQMHTRKEADLFITINHEQKKVAKSLLMTLLADIRMSSDDPKIALSALASATIRSLNSDNTSPLFRRFALPGMPAEPERNLTISEAINGLNRSELLGKVVHNSIIAGPLTGSTNSNTVERARKILNGYFDLVRNSNVERWEKGRTAYVCVNPGIRAHLVLIAEMIKYLEHKKGLDFVELDENDFIEKLTDLAQPVFKFIKEASDENIAEKFSRKFGEGGVKEYLFNLCELVNGQYNDFGSEDFLTYIKSRDDDRVSEADKIIIDLTRDISDYVISVLKNKHGNHTMPSGDPAWWEVGIQSRGAKIKAYERQQEDPPELRLPKEAYLDILDLKNILVQNNNWLHFEPIFNIPMQDEKHGKKYYTKWMERFNELRRIPAHKSTLRIYREEDFDFLDWLRSEFYSRMEKYK